MPENTQQSEGSALVDLVQEWLVTEQNLRVAERNRSQAIEAIGDWYRVNTPPEPAADEGGAA
jgi:hypothetical protein